MQAVIIVRSEIERARFWRPPVGVISRPSEVELSKRRCSSTTRTEASFARCSAGLVPELDGGGVARLGLARAHRTPRRPFGRGAASARVSCPFAAAAAAYQLNSIGSGTSERGVVALALWRLHGPFADARPICTSDRRLVANAN